jgi:hypothetical protein
MAPPAARNAAKQRIWTGENVATANKLDLNPA